MVAAAAVVVEVLLDFVAAAVAVVVGHDFDAQA